MSLDLQWLHEHMLIYFVYICDIEKFKLLHMWNITNFFFFWYWQNMLSLLHYQYERIHVKLKGKKHYLLGDIFLNTVMGVFWCWAWVFGFLEPGKIMGKFLDYCPLVDSMYKQTRKVAIFWMFSSGIFFFFF